MKLSALISYVSLASLVFAVPNPLPGGQNVTLRDPAIQYNSDIKKYFVFSTGEEIKIFTSASLKGPWSSAGAVLTDGTKIPLNGRDYWAPDVHQVNGNYVLYYSISSSGNQNSTSGVATSPTMESGTWNDLGEVIMSKMGQVYNAIDLNLIDAGGLKLAFGSYNQGIYQIPMSSISEPASPPPGTHLVGGDGQPTEGGFTYKPPRSKYFFQFFSNGKTPTTGATMRPPPGKEYKVLVGRSENVSGPYVDKDGHKLTEVLDPPAGSLVLGSHDNIYAPGGQSVYHDPVSDRDIMAYHYVPNNSFGGPSYLGINFLDFSSGWPVVVDE